ncbi:hypothetical protein Drose_05715 [Dactylosporangium roseum]|uniref:Helix-turn-helix DNA binding domain protein n=1 Tax=Dactylosporangium roseum TaxID=47989 RepID=A0ABY5ZAE2_9ACTN|nr:hypothetical protein [Dactylosporangium roseum]UWZ37767.1 hypothetical protein Drose_05715 [Dactylosporangium roseum]
MIRPKWQPASEEQRKALAAAAAAARKADRAEEETWKLILEARDAGVPDTVVCDLTNRSRATLNRKYGPRRDND